ncbi:MAG TPA: CinA family nicotinamide mononucleotide deamidase-related protein [Chlamydiales bacterium]|nr:CinA family nicotinamide mononucleotide deamidase-related protein [Chlamydiales bacterium]
MKIELIAVGDEVLTGTTINTNASFLAALLFESGFSLSHHHVVGDDKETLSQLIEGSLSRGSTVILTGGLGPTLDDYTRKIVADLFKVPLEYNEELFQELKERYKNYTIPLGQTLQDQATNPKGATLFDNEIGSASGFAIKDESRFPNALLIALPGVPQEMKRMAERHLIAYLQSQELPGKRQFVKVLHFVGLKEPEVDPLLRQLQARFPDMAYGIYPAWATLDVHIKAHCMSEAEFIKKAKESEEILLEKFGAHQFESPSGMLEEALHLLLKKHAITLATAESCTGGGLAAKIISQAGASAYFKGSVVAYSNDVKTALLDVSEALLQKEGAVSLAVTEQMAKKVAQLMNATCAVAVSGILGPTGGTDQKPVGTICATIVFEGLPVHSWTVHVRGNREAIAEKTVRGLIAELFIFIRKNLGT